jgi:hypothetical protein
VGFPAQQINVMRIDEIVALDADNDGRQPLHEMAFTRKRIIDAVANYQPRIVEHAIKIIVFPCSRDIPQWRDEIEGWTSYLSSLRVKTNNKPMGYMFERLFWCFLSHLNLVKFLAGGHFK